MSSVSASRPLTNSTPGTPPSEDEAVAPVTAPRRTVAATSPRSGATATAEVAPRARARTRPEASEADAEVSPGATKPRRSAAKTAKVASVAPAVGGPAGDEPDAVDLDVDIDDLAEPAVEEVVAVEALVEEVVVEEVVVEETVVEETATEEVETDSETPEAEAKPDEEEGAFVLTDDDDDAPAQQVATAGATADPVKDYLKQIGKVALLNAEQEVELAKRIEAGLFAEEQLNGEVKLDPKLHRELYWIRSRKSMPRPV